MEYEDREYKLGEEVIEDGKLLKVSKKFHYCCNCYYFYHRTSCNKRCDSLRRSDKTDIIFAEQK